MANEIKIADNSVGVTNFINTEVADNDYPVMGKGIYSKISGLEGRVAANIEALGSNPTKADFNDLLIKLKNAGLMTPDAWDALTVTKDIEDTVAGHAARQRNTEAITSVAESDGVITITLSKKVSALEDFDGLHGWGVHKWLGIGVQPWESAITGLYYNGSALTADDVEEAESVGLSSTGYFVRWVAADLVLAGDNTQKSKDTFTIGADGYATVTYKLKIIEPTT